MSPQVEEMNNCHKKKIKKMKGDPGGSSSSMLFSFFFLSFLFLLFFLSLFPRGKDYDFARFSDKWLLIRWPAARADINDSSPASTAAHTTFANWSAWAPGRS